MGTHLIEPSETYVMSTNMTRLGWFSRKSLHTCALEESNPSIVRIRKIY